MGESSNSFLLLDERIQRFIWSEGWSELRDAQEAAIPPILKADRDVIVAAATAAGKTEAFFFPALTHLLQSKEPKLIVYISPLKALINDQFGRLDRLCEILEVPVYPWHGDIGATLKQRFFKGRHGVLLITPESVEAMLCNRGSTISAIFSNLSFIVIDELHAFIGSERGKQLQSLMHRLDGAVGRFVPRVGLSATLGDMRLASDFLRPDKSSDVLLVESNASSLDLKLIIKGYEEPSTDRKPKSDASDDSEQEAEDAGTSPGQVAVHLFKTMRGSNNLVFPNSRREVERYTNLLNRYCVNQKVPNEFWPHHGNLSKELRYETEAALKQKVLPATAICTNTLELGIDIGAVKSVGQIGPPPSVASLRQRLGRSGRRKGESAILRAYSIEDVQNADSTLETRLRFDTLQMIAMVLLLIENWFEPPRSKGLHLSTLVQQVLSLIAQKGGATAEELFKILCVKGAPFSTTSRSDLYDLLRHMATQDLLVQDSSNLLLHGQAGERLVNHYSFYAAFASEEEYRLIDKGRTLGSLPISQMLTVGQRILFAGKTWLVNLIDEEHKAIYVTRKSGGQPPSFTGLGSRIHTRVIQRMRLVLENDDVPAFLDDTAKRFLSEARGNYQQLNLKNEILLDQGSEVMLLTWLGDDANEAIACILKQHGITAIPSSTGIDITKSGRTIPELLGILADLGSMEIPSLDDLLKDVQNLEHEKWDWALSERLLRATYASQYLDLEQAMKWLQNLRVSTASKQTSDGTSPSLG